MNSNLLIVKLNQSVKNLIISVNTNTNYHSTSLKPYLHFVGYLQNERGTLSSICTTKGMMVELVAWRPGLLLTSQWVGNLPTSISELVLVYLKVAEGLDNCECSTGNARVLPPLSHQTKWRLSGQSPHGSKGAGLVWYHMKWPWKA